MWDKKARWGKLFCSDILSVKTYVTFFLVITVSSNITLKVRCLGKSQWLLCHLNTIT